VKQFRGSHKKFVLNNYVYLGYFNITSQENRNVGEARGIERPERQDDHSLPPVFRLSMYAIDINTDRVWEGDRWRINSKWGKNSQSGFQNFSTSLSQLSSKNCPNDTEHLNVFLYACCFILVHPTFCCEQSRCLVNNYS